MCNPVNAIAFAEYNGLYLLVGEGCFLKIYDRISGAIVVVQKVFHEQPIHGIRPYISERTFVIVIWGGKSLTVLDLGSIVCVWPSDLDFNAQHMLEHETDAWILDVYCDLLKEEVYFVTANNHVWKISFDGRARHVASVSSSMIYCAEIGWHGNNRIFIAVGTIFGDVLLWSFDKTEQGGPAGPITHHKIAGHEGSVFGIRMSNFLHNGVVTRVLISCSDDRTIKIWNVSDSTSTGDKLLASVMGHASRIWGVDILPSASQTEAGLLFMSRGEDGTVQRWQLKNVNPPRLQHEWTCSHHSGKNVWAMAVYDDSMRQQRSPAIATGGADGRVTQFRADDNLYSTFVMDQVRNNIIRRQGTLQQQSPTSEPYIRPAARQARSIILSLEGMWSLSRRIESANPAYPSGTLRGEAKFQARNSSDKAFSIEYLYSEWGEYHTDRGLTMKATREYVYRYKADIDEMSVWFVKPDDKETVDYLFHTLEFSGSAVHHAEANKGDEAKAIGYHLCINDYYNASYVFQWAHRSLDEWHTEFTVTGPQKDYVAKAKYTRLGQPTKFNLNDTASQIQHKLILPVQDHSDLLPPKFGAFKTYAWISEDAFLVTTQEGLLLLGTLTTITDMPLPPSLSCPQVEWEGVLQEDALRLTSIVSSLPCFGLALVGGSDGAIYFYHHQYRRLHLLTKLSKKLAYLRAQSISDSGSHSVQESASIGVVATCLGVPQAHFVLLEPSKNGSPKILREQSLDLDKDFIITSSLLINDGSMLLLGSRDGRIDIKKPRLDLLESESAAPLHEVFHFHEDAITCIGILPHRSGEINFKDLRTWTTSRDGTFAIHQISLKLLQKAHIVSHQILHSSQPSFGPNIEGACFNNSTGDLLLWGFRSTQFVVYNETQKTETMTVECGGAHRSWAFIPRNDGHGGGSFAWTKASVCCVHSQQEASHRVLQAGGHGREIKATALSPRYETADADESVYIATGAEDTAIRIFDAELRCLRILDNHTTGIQQLRWSKDGKRLFSSAGCEELFVWRITSIDNFGVGVVRESIFPRVTMDGDLRITDFVVEEASTALPSGSQSSNITYTIYAIYSDSSTRTFNYHPSTATKPYLLSSGNYTTACLTRLSLLYCNPNHTPRPATHLCTASTDGHIAIWPLSQISTAPATPRTTTWTFRTLVHQSSIKCLVTLPLSRPAQGHIIATAGDDGALALTRIFFLNSPSSPQIATASLLISRAHASAITGLAILNPSDSVNNNSSDRGGKSEVRFTIVSVGNDQRLKVWDVCVDGYVGVGVEGWKVRRVGDSATGVADAAALRFGVWGRGRRGGADEGGGDEGGEECGRLVVVGIGVEVWRVGGVKRDGGMVEEEGAERGR